GSASMLLNHQIPLDAHGKTPGPKHLTGKEQFRRALGHVMIHVLMPHLSLLATLGMLCASVLKDGPPFLLDSSFWVAIAAQVTFFFAAEMAGESTGQLLDLMAFVSYFFQVVFMSLPGFVLNQQVQTYRFLLQLVGTLFLFDVQRAAILAFSTYTVPLLLAVASGSSTDLFLNTIWADVLLMLGLLLLLNTISGALQLNSDPLVADPSLRDELAMAEARRSIMSVITDGEMVLKDDKIMQAGRHARHYLEGLLGKEVEVEGLLLKDVLHPTEVRHVPSICPSLKDSSSPASSFHVRLRDDRQAQIYTCAFKAGDTDVRWLACIRDDGSEVARAALASSPEAGLAEAMSDFGDSRPPSEPSASGAFTLASQRQELALPELESIGFTLDIYAEELTMLQVKLNFNISDLAHIDTGRLPTMKRWLVQKSVDSFHEWLIDQVQADLAGAPTVAFPGSFELHCPGNGGTLRASDVAVTKMHATSDVAQASAAPDEAEQAQAAGASPQLESPGMEAQGQAGTGGATTSREAEVEEAEDKQDLDCFLVHIECKNITQCAPELRRRSKSRKSRQTSRSSS
ncbi:unnamed protein product, partial [Symbiodinium sp. CCMP2456]